MNPTLKRLVIGVADRLGTALLVSFSLRIIAQARRKLRQWHAAR